MDSRSRSTSPERSRSTSPERSRSTSPERSQDPHNPRGYQSQERRTWTDEEREAFINRGSNDSFKDWRRKMVYDTGSNSSGNEVGDTNERTAERTRIISNRTLGTIVRGVRGHINIIHTKDEVNEVSREHDLNMNLVRSGRFADLTRKMTRWRESSNSAMQAYAQEFFERSNPAQN